jgi:hypothetical protein
MRRCRACFKPVRIYLVYGRGKGVSNNSRFLLPRLQSFKRLLYQLQPQGLFILRRQLGIPRDMDDTRAQDDTVRSDHFGDRQRRSDLHDRNAGFL